MLQLHTREIDWDGLLEFFRSWYVGHTSGEDMRYADYLHRHNSEALPVEPAVAEPGATSVATTLLSQLPRQLLRRLAAAAISADRVEVGAVMLDISKIAPSLAALLDASTDNSDYAVVAAEAEAALRRCDVEAAP